MQFDVANPLEHRLQDVFCTLDEPWVCILFLGREDLASAVQKADGFIRLDVVLVLRLAIDSAICT